MRMRVWVGGLCSVLLCGVPRSPLDAHVCLSWWVVFFPVVWCAAKSHRCAYVFELVGCVLSCCVLCREVPSMRICVWVGGLCSLLLCGVPRSPLDAHVCLGWWVVFSPVVCYAAKTYAHLGDFYFNNISNNRRQQCPRPIILTPDDDQIGRNM
jgi:hypothetical protein